MKRYFLLLLVAAGTSGMAFADPVYTIQVTGEVVETKTFKDTTEVQGRIDQINKYIDYLTWALIPAINDGLTYDRHPDLLENVNKAIDELKSERASLEATKQ